MPAQTTLLATMHRSEFLRAVEQAEAQAADGVRATLLSWSQRLEPYLREPECTIEQALDRYKRDHSTPDKAETSAGASR
jgi:hypothetical protein